MAKFALYAHLKAKPEKVAEVESFLKSAIPMAEKEAGTITWYAFSEDEGSYGIFDTFETEEAASSPSRRSHRQSADGKSDRALRFAAGDSQDSFTGGEDFKMRMRYLAIPDR